MDFTDRIVVDPAGRAVLSWFPQSQSRSTDKLRSSPDRRPRPSAGTRRGGSVRRRPAPGEYCLGKTATLNGCDNPVADPMLKRSTAVIFRKPSGQRSKPHSRPIFVRGEAGTDARDCVDIHDPLNFTNIPKSVWSRAYNSHVAKFGAMGAPRDVRETPSRPCSVASSVPCRPGSVASTRPTSVASARAPMLPPAFRARSCTPSAL